MDTTVWALIIDSIKEVGFPIVACIFLIWTLHKNQTAFVATLTTHTDALKDISDLNHAALANQASMMADIQVIKETVVRMEKRPCQLAQSRKFK